MHAGRGGCRPAWRTATCAAPGLTLLGAAQLRRRWPVLRPVPVAVLLVLLLAPNAYRAIGLLLLAAAVAWPAVRPVLDRDGRSPAAGLNASGSAPIGAPRALPGIDAWSVTRAEPPPTLDLTAGARASGAAG